MREDSTGSPESQAGRKAASMATLSEDASLALPLRLIAAAWFGLTALMLTLVMLVLAAGNSTTPPTINFILFFCETPAALAAAFGFLLGGRIIDPEAEYSSTHAVLRGILIALLSLITFVCLYIAAAYVDAKQAGAKQWVLDNMVSVLLIGCLMMALPVSLPGALAGWTLFRWSGGRRRDWLRSFPADGPGAAGLWNLVALLLVGVNCVIAVKLLRLD